jgi:hypothetical protein
MTRSNWMHLATLIRQNVKDPAEREALGNAITADFVVCDHNGPTTYVQEQEDVFVQACIKEA